MEIELLNPFIAIVILQELAHREGNLLEVSLECEVSRRQEFDDRGRNVLLESFSSSGNEVWIELAPYREEWRLRGSKVLLKLGVQLHVVGIVEEEIELYIDIAGSRQ